MKQQDVAREWLDAKKRADLHLLILSGGLYALGLKKMGFTQKNPLVKTGWATTRDGNTLDADFLFRKEYFLDDRCGRQLSCGQSSGNLENSRIN